MFDKIKKATRRILSDIDAKDMEQIRQQNELTDLYMKKIEKIRNMPNGQEKNQAIRDFKADERFAESTNPMDSGGAMRLQRTLTDSAFGGHLTDSIYDLDERRSALGLDALRYAADSVAADSLFTQIKAEKAVRDYAKYTAKNYPESAKMVRDNLGRAIKAEMSLSNAGYANEKLGRLLRHSPRALSAFGKLFGAAGPIGAGIEAYSTARELDDMAIEAGYAPNRRTWGETLDFFDKWLLKGKSIEFRKIRDW